MSASSVGNMTEASGHDVYAIGNIDPRGTVEVSMSEVQISVGVPEFEDLECTELERTEPKLCAPKAGYP